MKYHILSIGISQHQDPQANLNFASKDASDFFTLFTKNVANVGYKKLLTDNEATLSNIRTALGSELQNTVGNDDCFVLYYSGHGAMAPDAPDSEVFSHYLVPFDVTQDISNSCIPVEYIRDSFQKLGCKSKLFFLDSCFSGSVNSKSYGPSYKSIKKVKTISGEISGEGSVVFTASKSDEKSIEDPVLENGVFTSFLLKELQSLRAGEQFSITDTVTPITENVIRYTSDAHHFKQTPTFSGELKGLLYLPVFKRPLIVQPDIYQVPKSQQVVSVTPSVSEIDVPSDISESLIADTISFVLQTYESNNAAKKKYEMFALQISRSLIKKWEGILENAPGDVSCVPDTVAKLVAESHQLFVLTAVVGVYGSESQARLIGEICGDLLKSIKSKAGLIALINVPEVVIVFIEYLLAMTAIRNSDFSKLNAYMQTTIFGYNFDSEPPTMAAMYHTHYADALTGHADKVSDYVRQVFKEMEWITEVHPRITLDDIEDLQIQANFVLSVTRHKFGQHGWPDFGRFYGTRILPMIEKLKYDPTFASSFAQLLSVKDNDLRNELIVIIDKMNSNGLGAGYWWNSIDGDDLMTKKEVIERDQKLSARREQ